MSQIPKGYKQTEVGVIPEEWEVCRVNEFTVKHKQGFYTKDKYVPNGIRLVRITDLNNPKINYEAMPCLKITEEEFKQYKISSGDFLFARSGAIGRYGIVENDIDAIFGSYIIRFNFDCKKISNLFFGYLFESNMIWNQLNTITQGSSNININANNIKSLSVTLPEVEEQEAIAGVLSDADALIEASERLIAKKRLIKQGAMQHLLTPKPDWEVKKLGEICDYQNGTSLEKYFNNEDGLKVISIGNYSPYGKFVETNTYINESFRNIIVKFIVKKNELTMILNDKTAVGVKRSVKLVS